MSTPKRIQRKRTKGWRMPEGAVYVGRPTIWGNEWGMEDAIAHRIKPENRQSWLVAKYASQVAEVWPLWDEHELEKLRGKDLCCWCPLDVPCHADVLLKLANR